MGSKKLDEILNSDSDDDQVPDPFKDVAKINNGITVQPMDFTVINIPQGRLETTSGTN